MEKHKAIKPLAGHATVDRIKILLRKFETIRPAFTSILGLFGPIFIAQERARESVVVHPGKVTKARLESFNQQECALIDKSAFRIDMASAKLLFGQICTIAMDSDAKEIRLETELMRAMTAEDFDSGPLFLAVIDEDEGFIEAMALEHQTTAQALMLLAYNSIKPSLESGAYLLRNYLSEDIFWQKPGCPVCGSPPVLSVLDAGGNRILICGFCWSEWRVPRIRCPFCLETDSRKLHYQSCDQEKEYRIEICDRCRSYLKTVDTRELDRPFYAPLESLVSGHLDSLMKNFHAA